MDDLSGKNLGKYKLEELLGHGGMSDVYKAYHPNLKRHVAVKVMHQHLSLENEYLERFKREAAAVAQLRHYHIVQVYDFDFEGVIPYMVMEFIAGETLDAKLNIEKGCQKGLSLDEAAEIFLPLSAAIKYAHTQGVIHRDIKPSNIMFTADGQIVLADFGIAHIMGNPKHTPTGAFVGTPKYMSPEQCMGLPVDGRSDLYSLGILLFLLLTGQTPFQGDNIMEIILQQIQEPVPQPCRFNPGLTNALEQVIFKALEKDPDDRYHSVDDLAQAFVKAAQIKIPVLNDTWETYDAPANAVKPYIGTAILISEDEDGHIRSAFQPPRDVPDFVGRKKDLEQLYRTFVQEPIQNLVCITGMGGIGKTALVTRAAHTFRDYFPDGVLWANIAASDPLAILDSWTHAIGADFSRLPDREARATALRNEFNDKRALFILDGVRNAEEIQLLLPSGPGCVALITTKNLDLPVTLKAHEIHLSEMPNEECHQLLTQIVGAARVEEEVETADAMFELLGYLPLAVNIAARRLASRRRWQIEDLFVRLRDERSRLDVLKMSDIAVRSSIAISWDDLDRDLQRTFSLIAVFEERSFRTSALAAVADLDRTTARDHLDTLVSYSLLFEEGQKHYRQHTLLTNFAGEQLGDNPVSWRRMAEFYLSYANEYRGSFLALEEELANISAGMQKAYQLKAWQQTLAFAEVLHDFWATRGHFSTARKCYQWACEAAEALDNQRVLADNLCNWAEACIEQNDYDEAKEHLYQSRQIFEGLKDLPGLGHSLYHLGQIAVQRAQYAAAEILLGESKKIREETGDNAGVAETLYRMAFVQYYYKNFEETKNLVNQALELQEAGQDWRGTIRSLNFLADIEHQQGDPDLALEICQRAWKLCEETQEQAELAITYSRLSDIHQKRNDLQLARKYRKESLRILKRTGDRKTLAQGYYKQSILNMEIGDFSSALLDGQRSLSLCQELDDAWGSVYVLLQIGDIQTRLNEVDSARKAWEEGLNFSSKFPEQPLSQLLTIRLNHLHRQGKSRE